MTEETANSVLCPACRGAGFITPGEEDERVAVHRYKSVRPAIQRALLEDANRSNHAIAKLTGCSTTTVASVRRELEASGAVLHYVFPGSRGNRAGRLAPCCASGQHSDPAPAATTQPARKPSWSDLLALAGNPNQLPDEDGPEMQAGAW